MSDTTAPQTIEPDVFSTPTGAPIRTARLARRPAPVPDATEAMLRRKARLQGLLLMIGSSAITIGIILGAWLSFR